MTRAIKFPFEWVVDHLCTTYGFLKHFDTNFIYLYIYISIYLDVLIFVLKNANFKVLYLSFW